MPRELTYILDILNKITDWALIKSMCSFIFVSYGFFFDVSHSYAFLALFILVLLDFAFGIAAAKKTGKQITSAKFYRTPIKLVVYFTLIAASRIAEYALPNFLCILDETLLGFLVATELISMFESAGYLGYAVPMKLLNQLHKFTDDQ